MTHADLPFSVVIPTYNRANDLRRCLNSLLLQTYRRFEVLVCDDGSTDASRDVASEFSDRLTLRYFWREHWGGPARPRNVGIREAAGEWICFLDSDDWWFPGKLEATLPHLESADVIFHRVEIVSAIGRTGEIVGRAVQSPAFVDLLTRLNAVPNSSAMVRRKLVQRLSGLSEERNLVGVEDFDLWLRVARHTERFVFLPHVLGAYWEGGAEHNLSASRRHIENERFVWQRYRGYLSASDLRQADGHWNRRLETLRGRHKP